MCEFDVLLVQERMESEEEVALTIPSTTSDPSDQP